MQKTIEFKTKPSIISTYTVAGPKESSGPIGNYIHKQLKEDTFGEKTFEKAECKMLSAAIKGSIETAKFKESEIGALFSGDLLNQIISASFSARDFDIPYIGIYSACSTMSQSIAMASSFINAGYIDNAVCATGSHFATAERQYRYPLELGCTRPPQAQWTVTGAGSCLITKHKKNFPSITKCTFGRVVDFGVIDANNMGAAMAPACADTILKHFLNTNTTPKDYDLILTGDLGTLGSRLLKELLWEKGYELYDNHVDCGEMIYTINEKEYQGASGAGCSAVVLNSFIYDKLINKKLKRILFSATGALLSTLSSQQGESIPGISHLVELEVFDE